jgi:malate dehydrogenase (oxaloacetate-decarboxylating)
MKQGISLTGNELLESPLLNKGTAFSEAERIELGLLGLLPPHIETLEVQIDRAYEAYSMFETDMEGIIICGHYRTLTKPCFMDF